ncbi:MAG: tail protein X [Anaerotignum propionicum]|uniref:tail protein X n=1 Tax=Anaerotignum propionicum TaxID=28446 RepID=UPI002B206026|nr:tail protein X [Anaerotignum propionicum]MEA5057776.1 tail protein X [Anaerotignum propionicum]
MTKYITIAGDMWDGIAYKTLGKESYTDKLMKENPKFRHLVVFPAGVALSIPDVKTEVSAQLPPWKRGIL